MTRAISIELFKVFNRSRSYIGFLAVIVLIVLLMIVFYSEGETLFGFVSDNLDDTFTIQGDPLNGNLYAYLVLKSLWVHFPILIALVTGDLVSGERQSGTLRLILSRPITRTSLITAKFITGIVYVATLVLFMAVLSLVLGYIAFGQGDLLVIMNKLNIFEADDVLWRFVGSYAFGVLSMATVAALSILMSTVLRSSVAAILGTIAVIIVLNFIGTFSIPVFDAVKPWIFSTYMNSWQDFFTYDLEAAQLMRHAFILLAHIVVFYAISVIYFNKKDITS